MNMDQYKKSMSEIKVKNMKTEDLLKKNSSKTRKLRVVKLIPILFSVIFAVILMDVYRDTPDISINVYAAEKEITLTKDFIDLQLTANPLIGSSTIDSKGNKYDSFVNYNINFACKGENIETITFTCNDQTVTMNNRLRADAYFVENINIPTDEYNNYKLGTDADFIYGFYGENEDTASVTKLIGNTYTVAYEEQGKSQYGLVIAASVDETGNYQTDKLTIQVDIKMTDGSSLHKDIVMKPLEDAFEGFQIRVS